MGGLATVAADVAVSNALEVVVSADRVHVGKTFGW